MAVKVSVVIVLFASVTLHPDIQLHDDLGTSKFSTIAAVRVARGIRVAERATMITVLWVKGTVRALYCKYPNGPSTYLVECRVSVLGITIMPWGSIPHNCT